MDSFLYNWLNENLAGFPKNSALRWDFTESDYVTWELMVETILSEVRKHYKIKKLRLRLTEATDCVLVGIQNVLTPITDKRVVDLFEKFQKELIAELTTDYIIEDDSLGADTGIQSESVKPENTESEKVIETAKTEIPESKNEPGESAKTPITIPDDDDDDEELIRAPVKRPRYFMETPDGKIIELTRVTIEDEEEEMFNPTPLKKQNH